MTFITSMIYQIKIKGELDKSWRDWLGDVEITLDLASYGSVTTTLTIDATDQPVLFGVLDRVPRSEPRPDLCDQR